MRCPGNKGAVRNLGIAVGEVGACWGEGQNGEDAVGGEEDGRERDWEILAADEGGCRRFNDGSRGWTVADVLAGIDGYDNARVGTLRFGGTKDIKGNGRGYAYRTDCILRS